MIWKIKVPVEMQAMIDRIRRRPAAIANGCTGLVPIRCGDCGRLIATSAVDRAKGEPDFMFDWPEDANGWTCIDCAKPWTAAEVPLSLEHGR